MKTETHSLFMLIGSMKMIIVSLTNLLVFSDLHHKAESTTEDPQAEIQRNNTKMCITEKPVKTHLVSNCLQEIL